MHIVTTLVPLVQRCASESHRIASGFQSGIPVNVVIDRVMVVGPITAEQAALVEINNISFEREAGMRFWPAPLELLISGKGEDVISDQVGRAIMLMKPAVRC